VTHRRKQVEHLIRAEVSELLSRQVNDPRLKGLVTVTEVSASPDLKQARIFISVMGDEEEKGEVLQGLTSACSFLRHELAKRISLRYIPELSFEQDDSIERGIRLSRLIEQVSAEGSESGQS
jgi:ribosome-binding factor A